ncbi:Protein of unknown function C-terminus [Ornithinibacillus halophilus]|uniref:DUF2399 domain-containing protein n=2 Tax=Ornithinibacillus halophilus TaxID=930117 RepID=A0A1M5KG10_9BACI|nr:Protein of unknown function C-terminus [Ornithinibacillus halophilus]
MDMLVKEGCTLYYSGDLDPEGISMAERLLHRYPGQAKLWKMDIESYYKSISDVELTDERLSKLESITTPELQPVVEEMKKKKRAGYQEALV